MIMGCINGGKSQKISRKRRRNGGEPGNRAVQRKVEKLQKIIPGGGGLKPDRLLMRTADYILLLRMQINVLKYLSHELRIP
ncbi:hypothetical protein CDL12_02334 [Handroanthus impetiginosus]|uniref:BHLH domain-containing protein n=1 Tax=Handroanthus impetiginosus TaxID=429701 RepID=A0A2G9I5C8_9LAMI|nr:hypothetical protein CDL12_02334 [Handroanthus impetiginosus]